MIYPYRWKRRYQLGAKLFEKRGGFAVLTSVIIISAVLLVIALSLGVNSISENQIGMYQSKAQRVFVNADGCAEEALIRLSRDNAYTGETISIDSTSCVISVAGNVITVRATNTNYSKSLRINVILLPNPTITSWQEITN